MKRLFHEVFFLEILYFIRLKNRRKTKQKSRNRNKNKNLKPKTGHPNKFTKKKRKVIKFSKYANLEPKTLGGFLFWF